MKNKDCPIPPKQLLDNCQRSDGGIEEYLRTSKIVFNNLEYTLKRLGRDLYSFRDILDFGCGSSRVLRCFKDHPKKCKIYGTDTDQRAIDWNKKNISFVKFYKNSKLPPTDFPDNKFDLIYSFSVFSHFDGDMIYQWLKELNRIMIKNGILLITICGDKAFKESKTWSGIDPGSYSKFVKKGFVYFTGNDAGLNVDLRFHHKTYILPVCSKFFKVKDYIVGGYLNIQDIIILKKLSSDKN